MIVEALGLWGISSLVEFFNFSDSGRSGALKGTIGNYTYRPVPF